MGTALELLNDIKAVNVAEVAKKAINATSAAFVQLNRAQMIEGKGKDRNIGKYSTSKRGREYAKFKNSKNPDAGLGNVDLRLTESFQEKMIMKLTGDDIEVDSSDSKAADLLAKYGGQIYGLNAKNQPVYNTDEFYPVFSSEIEKITGLKFV